MGRGGGSGRRRSCARLGRVLSYGAACLIGAHAVIRRGVASLTGSHAGTNEPCCAAPLPISLLAAPYRCAAVAMAPVARIALALPAVAALARRLCTWCCCRRWRRFVRAAGLARPAVHDELRERARRYARLAAIDRARERRACAAQRAKGASAEPEMGVEVYSDGFRRRSGKGMPRTRTWRR